MRSIILFRVFLLMLTIPCVPLYAYELTLGGAAYAERMPYKDESYSFTPFPMVQFESKYFYFDTTTAGIYVHQTDNTSLTVIADYYSMSFDPDDSDDNMMEHIDKRRPTVMAGVNLTAWGPYGIVRAQVLNDVLFQSEGARAKLAYLLYFNPGGMQILPEIGAFWYSGMHNRYYYGVTGGESRRSGFVKYKPDGSFTPYIALNLRWDFTEHLRLSAKTEYFILPSEVKDSPIVDKSKTVTFFAGLSYIF